MKRYGLMTMPEWLRYARLGLFNMYLDHWWKSPLMYSGDELGTSGRGPFDFKDVKSSWSKADSKSK